MSLCIGLGLSAACGFRVFVPLLTMSIAAHSGHLNLASGFSWIGSTPALITFSIATALEIGGYYIPWLDHFLDTVATPAAIVAGTIVTASMVTDVSPFLKWTLAVIAGGGAAGAVQATTVLARGASFVGTGGLGNPLIATAELGGSVMTAALAIIAPMVAIALVIVAIGTLALMIVRKKMKVAL
ncbi:MAG: DUF4126 domain-containing protein [Verrucomicrobiota bacterium]|nr:DUF4126 domain-containing protein [Verrucomicrobiota bacterium]